MALPIVLKQPNPNEGLAYFTNHLSEFVRTKDFWDKGLKAVSKSSEIAEWGSQLAGNDSAAFASHEVKVLTAGTRAVTKLFDFVGSLKVPKKDLDQGQLAGTILVDIGYGSSDLFGAIDLFHDLGVIDLGKARVGLSTAANCFYGVAHITTLVMDSIKMDNRNHLHAQYLNELRELEEDLQSFQNQYSINTDDPLNTIQVSEEENVDDVWLLFNQKRLDIAKKKAQIEEVQFEKTTTALKLAQTVFDIVALIFSFVLMIVTIPLIIITPIMAILGLSSAGTALAKLWLETGPQPTKPDDLILARSTS